MECSSPCYLGNLARARPLSSYIMHVRRTMTHRISCWRRWSECIAVAYSRRAGLASPGEYPTNLPQPAMLLGTQPCKGGARDAGRRLVNDQVDQACLVAKDASQLWHLL